MVFTHISGWGNIDTRHLSVRGHHELGMLVASFFHDVSCDMLREPEPISVGVTSVEKPPGWPELTLPWRDGDELMPAMWNTPIELGLLPRMRTLDGWNPDTTASVPPFHPTCLSTRSSDPRFKLTPIANDGWEYWIHPDFQDKPYWLANSSSATISFELETRAGIIKMYSLRSRTFGLGTVSCWVGDDTDRAVKTVGFWDNDACVSCGA